MERLTMKGMDKDATLTFRLPSSLRRLLEAAATADRRTVGSFTVLLLEEAIAARGLPTSAKPRAKPRGAKGRP